MKRYQSGNELLTSLLKGSQKLEENVGGTLGPQGKTVILRGRNGKPLVTKDGVTVANFVDLEDPFEDLACQILKQASNETVKEAGDGTTTSTVLAHAIFKEAIKYVHSGIAPVDIKRGLEKSLEIVCEEIRKRATDVQTKEDIINIASISSNNDEAIGNIIADAIEAIGNDGSIVVETGKTIKTELELVEGFRIQGGYADRHFINDETRNVCHYRNPYFLITDHHLEDLEGQLIPVLEKTARDKRPVIIIADSYSEEVAAACVYNAVQSRLNLSSAVKVALIKAPSVGEERSKILEDMAMSVGAKFFSMFRGDNIADATLLDLGGAQSIEANGYFTIIIDGQGDAEDIQKRINALKEEIKHADRVDGPRIQERITRLSSGIAKIKVGGLTEVEVTEKRHRVEDALEAVNSARVEGIIGGGGSTLCYIAKYLEINIDDVLFIHNEDIGFKILMEALRAPFKRIAANSGYSWEVSLNKMMDGENENMGIDFRTGNLIDLKGSGIIDPAKVTRVALQNAVSAASTLLTTNNAIVEENS